MIEKQLGRIQECRFGHGGYQDAMIGISFSLGGEGWGVGDFWGDWFVERSTNAKWTEEDRIQRLGKTVLRINDLLTKAKVETIDRLKGIPVEVTFDSMTLKEWRVLTEVL